MNAEQHTLTVPTSSTAPPEVYVFMCINEHEIIDLYMNTVNVTAAATTTATTVVTDAADLAATIVN
jgi:hypothetical protein